ncbi:MAG: hypothetical protein ABR990_03585 [Terracidiphilus sp.]|jgi:hypothetical protein
MENNWVKRNKWIYFVAPLALVLFVWIGGEVVMRLWNWLLPAIFGWRLITFWQAIGLLVLCRILFGGCGAPGSHHCKPQRPTGESGKQMTTEEREKLRQDLRSRCCGNEAPVGEPKEQG